MATVKFSKELRDRIVQAAKQKFQTAVHAAEQTVPKDWGDRLYDILMGPYADQLRDIPREFLFTTDKLVIDRIGEMRVGLTYQLTMRKPFPAAGLPKGFCARKMRGYGDDLTLDDTAAFAEFKAEIEAWHKRVNAAKQRQREFAESVEKVIGAFATLAPALKQWPPLWELIPDDVKEKHKQIVERKVKEVELNVDLDRMTALASFTKIRGHD